MKNIEIQQVNNGFLVRLTSMHSIGPVVNDFETTMKNIAKSMTK